MPKSIRFTTAAMLGALAIATAAEPATSSAAAAAEAAGKPASFVPVPSGTVLNVGDQQQEYETLFKVSGVGAELPFKVNFVQFADGPLVNAGFAAGRLDVGQEGNLPAALSVSDKLPVRAIAMFTSVGSDPSEYLLAKPGIRSIADLRGKPVAYTTGTQEQAFALQALAQAGLSQSDVQQVNVPLEELFTVLESGSVDASVVGTNDELIYRQTHPKAVALATNLTVKPQIYLYWVATTSALANPAKKAAIEDFVTGLVLASNWAYKNKKAWATDYEVDVEHETPAQAKLGLNSNVDERYEPYTSSVSAAQQDVVNLMSQAGAIKSAFSIASLYSDTSWWPIYAKILKEVPQIAS